MRLSSLALTVFGMLAVSSQGYAENYVEPGRFGIEGIESDSGFQVGVIRETDSYEVAVDFDGSAQDKHKSTTGTTITQDMGVEFRTGARFNLGTYNYASAGAFYGTSLFGQDAGVSTRGSYIVGPYLGFQRHFSGTSLMLSLYVLPVNYARNVGNDGSGNQVVVCDYQFFQNGAFGLAILF